MPESYFTLVKKMSKNLKLYFTASFFAYLGLGAGNVLVNLYLVEKGFSADVVGMYQSIKLFTTGLLALPAGMVCNKMGFKWSLKQGLFFIGTGILILVFFDHQLFVYLSSFVWGLGLSVFAVSAPPFIQENAEPRQRQQAFSINFAVMMLSQMMGNLISGRLVEFLPYETLFSYRITLGLFTSFTLVGILFLTGIKETIKPFNFSLQGQLKGIINLATKNNYVPKLLTCHILIGVGAGLIVPLLNVFLKENVGATIGQIGTIMSISQTTTAFAALMAPFIVLRLGKIKGISLLRLSSIPFLLAIALLQNVYVVGVAVFIRSSLMNMTHPVESELSMGLVEKEERAPLSALLKTMDSVGRAFSVLLGGYLMSNIGYTIPYYLTCIIYVFATILFYKWFNHIEKDKSQLTQNLQM
ncbi:MFS transporter [Alkalicella caledoniensis]|uniref:MFS transporter n=1 Tax=Alkalicella caledoniensis TaxID=2731377 RepID=A0A7G9W6U5_ALKCA|nr:MFS transporter [Alkalicella caledoniensis]QNO14407.1 MFS transporter [Alkalicella caledoniensis]